MSGVHQDAICTAINSNFAGAGFVGVKLRGGAKNFNVGFQRP